MDPQDKTASTNGVDADTADATNQTANATRRVRLMLILLTVQYFVGMSINLMGPPSLYAPAIKRAAFGILMLAHVIIAITLLVMAGRTLASVRVQHLPTNRLEIWGASSVVAAFFAGILTVTTTLSRVFAFLMAVGFILAFIFYGQLYFKLRLDQR
jgi:cation transport ATPase